MKIIALVLVTCMASCGGTGGGPSSSGKPFVFQGRGRLNLIAQPIPNTPKALKITATLLDPQGNPFRDQIIAFSAEFGDATIVPVLGNPTGSRGVAITDDLGQARVTLLAGLTLGRMRLLAETLPTLNIASAISVEIKEPGFIGGTELAILPTSVLFVNPLVRPGTDGPFTIFSAVGGAPPFRWDHTNRDLAKLDPQGLIPPNIYPEVKYTLIGPIPTEIPQVLEDTVRLTDSRGDFAEAPVTVIFASCELTFSAPDIIFDNARPGDKLDIRVTNNGVPPFTISHTFPTAGTLTVTDGGIITYTVSDPVVTTANDTVIVRDSRGCVGTFTVSITPASVNTLTLTAIPANLPDAVANVDITAIAFDIDNQPFVGATIVFTTTIGTLIEVPPATDPVTAVTDANGKARVILRVGDNPGTDPGPPPTSAPRTITVTATAATAGGGKTATVDIIQD
ncbi:MAG: hypothetical protein EXR78_00065 [Deltaproteobacteria bacterium]|nr:hypothetical protein [Deltaproteobacteria bacterium]